MRNALWVVNLVRSCYMEGSPANRLFDSPKCLRDPVERQARMSRIRDPHVRSLSEFVERVRAEGHEDVPFFDPLDGGVDAECLFVSEAPGPKAVFSGFVSRNNPDETAKNWLELNAEAGIDRRRTAIWNIIPWYLGDGTQIRAATAADITQGLPYLMQVLEILASMRIIGLVGRAAGKVRGRISDRHPKMRIVNVPHPSPTFINRAPQNRMTVLDALLEVALLLHQVP